mmetsp:Transcript_33974/g.41071  ORF Transcript_33974/g.41071 Transcript_33974/m.41071 type:complete len:99 (+) Transcript_33974:318-614(+)
MMHVTVVSNTANIHTSAFFGCDCLHSIAFTPTVMSLGPSAFLTCEKLLANFISKTMNEVGIVAFARYEINSINLPPHATQDIYTFVNSKREIAHRMML